MVLKNTRRLVAVVCSSGPRMSFARMSPLSHWSVVHSTLHRCQSMVSDACMAMHAFEAVVVLEPDSATSSETGQHIIC